MQKTLDDFQTKNTHRPRTLLLLLGVILVFFVVYLLAYRLVSGKGLGLRSIPRAMVSTGRAAWNREDVIRYSRDEFTNIIFLHHSTGQNLIEQGGVRDLFSQAGYDFWDQGYNQQGLRAPDGSYVGYAYSLPYDNTDPDGLARVFSQAVYDLPLNAFSGLLQHEVIIFKSCFAPTSKITSDQQLAQYQDWYLQIRDSIDQHPEKIFILVTQPPLNPAETNPQESARARNLADWLTSEEYLAGHQNLFAFNLFDYLAEDDPSSSDYNMLRKEYRWGADSHPNRKANEAIGPLLVDFVNQSIETYRSSFRK
jgi:hypothetical protein